MDMHPSPPRTELDLITEQELARHLLLGVCFLREAPERAIGSDRRAGKWGLRGKRGE